MTAPAPGGTARLFIGLLGAQGVTALTITAFVAVLAGQPETGIALWGGVISLLGYLWAGFQMWLHPGNARPVRSATRAIRAEFGRVVIVLLLLWLTLDRWPETRAMSGALTLFASLFLTQLAGLIWLVRAAGEPGGND